MKKTNKYTGGFMLTDAEKEAIRHIVEGMCSDKYPAFRYIFDYMVLLVGYSSYNKSKEIDRYGSKLFEQLGIEQDESRG